MVPSVKVQLNKRIVWASILGVVAVAFSIWYTATPSIIQDTKNAQEKREQIQEKQRALALDSDNDGLKDWEELLAGTDPKNPDSDGDGVSDFESVQNMRVKEAKDDDSPTAAVEESKNTNLTEQTARKIFGAYMRAKLSDTYNKDSFSQVIGNVTKDVFNSTKREDPYSTNDIKAITKATKSNVVKYRAASDKAMASVMQIQEYELSTYARAIENDDEKEYAKLTSAANAYKVAVANLLVVPVPSDILKEHVELLNALDSFADTLTDMGAKTGDAILSHVHTRNFIDKEERLNDVFKSLYIYFSMKYGIKVK